MRRRRAAGSSSLGALRATSRDITSKSKASRCVPPSDARSASGRCPACEWMNAARRMSESLIDRAGRRVARNALRLALLRGLPDVGEHARGHRPVAVDDLAVELQLLGDVREHAFGRADRRAPRGAAPPRPTARTAVPRRRRRAARGSRARAAARACAAARRRCPRGAISCSTSSTTDESERSVPGAGPVVDQHQRKVVAQPRRGRDSARAARAAGRGRRSRRRPRRAALPVEKNSRCS